MGVLVFQHSSVSSHSLHRFMAIWKSNKSIITDFTLVLPLSGYCSAYYQRVLSVLIYRAREHWALLELEKELARNYVSCSFCVCACWFLMLPTIYDYRNDAPCPIGFALSYYITLTCLVFVFHFSLFPSALSILVYVYLLLCFSFSQ